MKRSLVGISLLLLSLAACGDAGTAVVEATAPSLALPEVSFAVATPAAAAETIDDKLGSSGFVLLDVRTPEEYSEGHIAGSANVDFYEGEFADRIAELDRNAEYVVYCRSGNRSGQTTELMRELGFTNVTDIGGGIVEWQAAGLPIER